MHVYKVLAATLSLSAKIVRSDNILDGCSADGCLRFDASAAHVVRDQATTDKARASLSFVPFVPASADSVKVTGSEAAFQQKFAISRRERTLAGYDIYVKSCDGSTTLHIEAVDGTATLDVALIQRGADVHAKLRTAGFDDAASRRLLQWHDFIRHDAEPARCRRQCEARGRQIHRASSRWHGHA
jgi:hypothetical protein